MKYSDVIQFEPIETVVQLREADAQGEARRLVETFVISDRMSESLRTLVFPQLQFEQPADNKGLLIVGNYGTGKSHLMALISAISEHASIVEVVNDASVREEADRIAGKFKVFRAEIGATTMSLRDIICQILEIKLEDVGVDYQFPEASETTGNKGPLEKMMACFEEKYPDKGLLLILDELLDFLRTRNDQQLMLDLNFLREVGEVCKSTRFRFISGVQETLFDNPRFQFAAESLRRVQARFEQVRIAREDVAYVVSQRLLKKTAEQKSRIREHLEGFAALYGSMNEQMERFVELFPVHPAYLDTFQKVYVAEKREILKTLSSAMKAIINQEVPEKETGLISYDAYWDTLKGNPSFRSIPEIREVIDKSNVLEDRVQHAFPKKQYKPVALRVIHGLSVHRLTTDDIFAHLGATAEELRDDLCLILPLPEKDATFLATLVETVLNDILKTVNGQFLSFNKENSQYYLDLKKDTDFDSLIAKKAETLSENKLDSYYFDALARVMEASSSDSYVSGYKIWQHELEWRERGADRDGYLFFGAPNERSTAQPPRDFYLYFLQPFDPPTFKNAENSDEVFFKLAHPDDTFAESLRLYAGAREQATTAAGQNKTVYQKKADEYLSNLTQWLRKNMGTAFEVSYQGSKKSLQETIHGLVPAGGGARLGVREMVNLAGSACLASHFQDLFPDYPTFGVRITGKNRGQTATEAIRWLNGSVQSKQGAQVLDALGLLDGEVPRPAESRYSKSILAKLDSKGEGQVVNRSELVEDVSGREFWMPFRMEPEFLAVVLAALVHSGHLVTSLPGKKLDAGSIEQFHKFSTEDLISFKHVERPKGLPLAQLKVLFEKLNLSTGKLTSEKTRDQAVQDLQTTRIKLVDELVRAQARIQDGFPVWGRPVLSDDEKNSWAQRLSDSKAFLESLQAFKTVGKLNNFPHTADEIRDKLAGLEVLKKVEKVSTLSAELNPFVTYLSMAEAVMPTDHPWVTDVKDFKTQLQTELLHEDKRLSCGLKTQLVQRLKELRQAYIEAYLDFHQKVRLGPKDDDKKAKLLGDFRLKQLQALTPIEILPQTRFDKIQDRLLGLESCFHLSQSELGKAPVCNHCSYRPSEEPPGALTASDLLDQTDEDLDTLLKEWAETLLVNLDDPTVQGNIELLSDGLGKEELAEFLVERQLPDDVSKEFVQALQDALKGLDKVAVVHSQLHSALVDGGLPCTVDELQERFKRYLADLTKGREREKVRIVVE